MLTPVFPTVVTLAAHLRDRSVALRLRRPFTVAESICTALVAEGLTYDQAARIYGAAPSTVATHARVVAAKVLDGVEAEPDLERLPIKLRVFTWARREVQKQEAP